MKVRIFCLLIVFVDVGNWQLISIKDWMLITFVIENFEECFTVNVTIIGHIHGLEEAWLLVLGWSSTSFPSNWLFIQISTQMNFSIPCQIHQLNHAFNTSFPSHHSRLNLGCEIDFNNYNMVIDCKIQEINTQWFESSTIITLLSQLLLCVSYNTLKDIVICIFVWETFILIAFTTKHLLPLLWYPILWTRPRIRPPNMNSPSEYIR